jgi:hypothetical protein
VDAVRAGGKFADYKRAFSMLASRETKPKRRSLAIARV